jgi:hypothetical protein
LVGTSRDNAQFFNKIYNSTSLFLRSQDLKQTNEVTKNQPNGISFQLGYGKKKKNIEQNGNGLKCGLDVLET